MDAVTHWMKKSLKLYVNGYPNFLKKIGYHESDTQMLTSIINQTHSEPSEDIIKMTSHMLGIKIKLFNIKQNNYVVLTYGPENNLDTVTLLLS